MKGAATAAAGSGAEGRSSASSSATEPRRRPGGGALTVQAGVLAFLLALFALLSTEAVSGLALGAENDVLRELHAASSPLLDSTMRLVSDVGRGRPLALVAAAIVGLLALRRRWRDSVLLALAMAGAALDVPLKLLFDRPRPQLWPTETFQSSSFPSGHAMSSAVFVAALVVLAWRTRWRIPVALVGALALVAVGLSRLLVGAHYPSDVLGGWSFAFAWVTGLLLVERVVAPRAPGEKR